MARGTPGGLLSGAGAEQGLLLTALGLKMQHVGCPVLQQLSNGSCSQRLLAWQPCLAPGCGCAASGVVTDLAVLAVCLFAFGAFLEYSCLCCSEPTVFVSHTDAQQSDSEQERRPTSEAQQTRFVLSALASSISVSTLLPGSVAAATSVGHCVHTGRCGRNNAQVGTRGGPVEGPDLQK